MALIFGSSPLRIAASRWVGPKRATHAMPSQLSAGHGPLESWPGPQGAPSKPCFDGEFDCGYRCVSSGSGASLGAVRRNFMSPSPVALPARFLKESAAVSPPPTFFGARSRDPLVQRHAIFFREPLGSLLDGEGKLQWVGSFTHGFTFFNRSPGRSTEVLNRSGGPAKSATL